MLTHDRTIDLYGKVKLTYGMEKLKEDAEYFCCRIILPTKPMTFTPRRWPIMKQIGRSVIFMTSCLTSVFLSITECKSGGT